MFKSESINGFAAFIGLWERKILAKMQMRVGPLYAGKFEGILQPIADLLKLMSKEIITPRGVDKPIFWAVPLITTAIAASLLAVIPLSETSVIARTDVGVLIIFAILSFFPNHTFSASREVNRMKRPRRPCIKLTFTNKRYLFAIKGIVAALYLLQRHTRIGATTWAAIRGECDPGQQFRLVGITRTLAGDIERPRPRLTRAHPKFVNEAVEQFDKFIGVENFQVGQAIENIVDSNTRGETDLALGRSNKSANGDRCLPKSPPLMAALALAQCFQHCPAH